MKQKNMENLIGGIGLTATAVGTIALGVTGYKLGNEHLELMKEVNANISQYYQVSTPLISTIASGIVGFKGGAMVGRVSEYFIRRYNR